MINASASRYLALTLIAGAALFAGGCSLFEDDGGSGDAGSVKALVLFSSEVGPDGAPINPRNLFPPNVREIRATVVLEDAAVDMKVTGNWYQLGTANAGSEGQRISGSDIVLDSATVQEGRASLSFALRPGASGLPEDTWLLRVFVNDDLVKTAGFVVNRTAGATAPAQGAPAPTPTPVAYTVGAGDTLATIAQRFLPQGQNVNDFTTRLAQFNNLAANASLSAGQVIRIPPNQ